MKTNLVRLGLFRMVPVVILMMVALVVGVQAAEWKPNKPIQFVVPYAPGGGSDVLARSIENIIKTEKLCPVPLIVVNQAGGSGTIGMTSVAQSPGNVHMLMTFHLRPSNCATRGG